jgi:CheY-like chemotaxis protein
LGAALVAVKVSVVGDSVELRNLYAVVLEEGGYNVVAACDGVQAHKELTTNSLNMPPAN